MSLDCSEDHVEFLENLADEQYKKLEHLRAELAEKDKRIEELEGYQREVNELWGGVHVTTEQIGGLTFAFVAPLGSDQHCYLSHKSFP